MTMRIAYLLLIGFCGLFLSSGCTQKAAVANPGELQNVQTDAGSVLQRNVSRFGNLVDVRLMGANEASITEIFGKVAGSAPGVTSATRYSSQIVPDNPQACWILWRVSTEGEADVFRLQTEMMEMFEEIISAGGYVDIYSVPYRYSQSEIALLKGLRPQGATSLSLTFVVDRELARDREMAGY